MKRFILPVIALLVAAATCSAAAETTDTLAVASSLPTIVDHINSGDKACVRQPEGLNARLAPSQTASEDGSPQGEAAATVSGYRIRVFSGNNARTAQRDASQRATDIAAKFPEYSTYVDYDAPYWRLNVGDFEEYEDAASALTLLKESFPAFAREMRMVRANIVKTE